MIGQKIKIHGPSGFYACNRTLYETNKQIAQESLRKKPRQNHFSIESQEYDERNAENIQITNL